VTFNECDVNLPEALTVSIVDIKEVRPKLDPPATEVARPSLMAGGKDEIGEKQCGVYTKGEGKLTLCIESVAQWGTDVVQVNGFLENTGTTKLCDVKVGLESSETLYSVWPEWAHVNSWANDFIPKQVTAVGLTAPARWDRTYPHISVVDFNICGVKSAEPPFLSVVDLSSIKKTAVPDSEVARTTNSRRLALRDYIYIAPSQAIKQQGTPSLHPPIKAGECGVYTKGDAKLALCLESAIQWGANVNQVSGFLTNNGQASVCDLQIRPVGTDHIDNIWPDWAAASSYANNFNAGQTTAVGKCQ